MGGRRWHCNIALAEFRVFCERRRSRGHQTSLGAGASDNDRRNRPQAAESLEHSRRDRTLAVPDSLDLRSSQDPQPQARAVHVYHHQHIVFIHR